LAFRAARISTPPFGEDRNMHHHEEYKGHEFSVDTVQRGKGWSWTYQIDGGPLREGKDRPLPSEQLALQEAISNAKSAIDSMIKSK
jgi:hypothetical protein